MIIRELKNKIKDLDDDFGVLIGSPNGWSNVESIKIDGCNVYIEEERFEGIFTSDKE
jgi:hypothetical protein